MSGAAQQDEIVEEENFVFPFAATGTESSAGLKEAVSERLLAHRQRKAGPKEARRAIDMEPAARPARARTAASRVRDAVAARYQNSLTYREFLEQEAERALVQAQAEAEIAARNAEAMAAAQIELLEELQHWDQPVAQEIALPPERRGRVATRGEMALAAMELTEQALPMGMSQIEATAATATGDASDVFTAGLTVRLYEDLSAIRRPPFVSERRASAPVEDADFHEATALDAEIAFRRAPEFEQPVEPIAIAGNLIEFPRQLVAARKVRPRLAEGPLREESEAEPQLRIFEVEPEQVSAAPVETTSAPEWQSILLEGAPVAATVAHVEALASYAIMPQTAPLELRLMAAAVDACSVGAALIGFVVVGAKLAGPGLHALALPMMAAVVGIVGCALFVMYQLLFFTFGEATLGMQYARIGLCTFGDDNPTRSAMRRRVLATLLAAGPLGLGLAWAWMDEEGLGWHDRISRMYQRAY